MERLSTILKTAGISAAIASLAFTAGMLFNIINPHGISIRPAPPKIVTIVETVKKKAGAGLKSKAGDCAEKPVLAGTGERAVSTAAIASSGVGVTIADLPSLIAPIPPAEKLKDVPRLTLEKAREYYDSGKYKFVDARPQYKYIEAHIKGAYSLSASFFIKQFTAFKETVVSEDELVVYCSNTECKLSEIVSGELLDNGYKKINIFEGGWAEWEAKQFPMEGVKVKK